MRWCLPLLLLAACARASAPAQEPIQIVAVGEPEPEPPLPAPPPPPPVTAAPIADAGASDLPEAWLRPKREAHYKDSFVAARAARDAYAAAPDGGSTRTWFEESALRVDRATRLYAVAFYADDASPVTQIDSMMETAELQLRFAADLDAAGLAKLPRDWKSDPALGVTFEDVDVGPSRRWRDEARALARSCVDMGRKLGVDNAATKRCAEMRSGSRPMKARDASACPCAPGDPLCSTMGGWCP
jgi:hypothetical protein